MRQMLKFYNFVTVPVQIIKFNEIKYWQINDLRMMVWHNLVGGKSYDKKRENRYS